MLEKVIPCITCPIGCAITVRGEGSEIVRMTGNQCKRGEEYARNEFIHPERILTTTVMLEGTDNPLLPVRSDKPIPKELLIPCMQEIRNVRIAAPIPRYQTIIPDILGTGANIVATGEAKGR